jgi:proteasome alpha subunit
VVAEVGQRAEDDQIYRITFDGSVTDEPGYVAFGGQADQVSAALKERYSAGMSLAEAFAAALAALSASGNGERSEVTGGQLEVAILDRTRDHRTFRRIRAARLEELLSQARAAGSEPAEASGEGESGDGDGSEGEGQAPEAPAAPQPPTGPPTGPDARSMDRGSGTGGTGSGDGTPPNPV